MKYLKLFFAFLLLSLFFSSCNKELVEVEGKSQDFSIEEIKQVINQSSEQLLTFKSLEEFIQFTTGFQKLDVEQRNSLLANLNYQTFEQFISSKYDELEILESEDDELSFLKENKDYFIRSEYNGEFSIDILDESVHVTSIFLNKDRILQIGDSYYKFIGEYSFSSEDLQSLKRIRSVADLQSSELVYEKVVDIVHENKRSVNSWRNYSYTVNSSRCRSRRKVTLALAVVTSTITTPTGTRVLSLDLIARAEARRQGWTCSWYLYRTEMDWEDIFFKFELNGQLFSESSQNLSCENCRRLGIFERQTIFPSLPSLQWKEIRSRITSRGVGSNWLEIDETF